MPSIILTASFVALLVEFRPVFTKPSFESFVVLSSGCVHTLGGHRVTDMLRAAGEAASKHFTSYYRFFSHAQWSLDEFGLVLLGIVLRLFPSAVVELVLDDTLSRHTGKNIALASMHADPLLKQGGRCFHSYGHVFVVLAVHVHLPRLGRTGWALPILFRLFEGKLAGGRKDSPSDKRRAQDRRRRNTKSRQRPRLTDWCVEDGVAKPGPTRTDDFSLPEEARQTKLQLAAEMLLLVAQRFPSANFRVLADHLYNGRGVLIPVHSEVENMTVIARGRKDAALYDLPPIRKPGTMGRPPVRGSRLLNPEEWTKANPESFRTTTVTMYGRDVVVQVASYLGMAYRSLPGRLMRYVIVRDPDDIYRTDYFLCTDVTLSETEILEAYARRWPLERTFQDSKQKLGIEDAEVQRPLSVRRLAPFGMLMYSLIVLWFITEGHTLTSHHGRPADPWYEKTARPSFTDMIAVLRRSSWAEPHFDPESAGVSRQKVLDEYMARVVSAAA